jgi:hypothetical protein
MHESGSVKVFGCRPVMTAPRISGAGVRKPPRNETAGRRARRSVRRYGVSALAVGCRGALTGSLGSGRRDGELGGSIAIGRTDVVRRRLLVEAVVQGGATASMVMADQESAQQKYSTGRVLETTSLAAVPPATRHAAVRADVATASRSGPCGLCLARRE